MGKITFVPVGGLANRMRAVASAVTLAEKIKSELRIVWFQDWALGAPFSQLFETIDKPVACLRDATKRDYLLLDRPRSKNFRFPRLYQKISFDSCLYEQFITPLCKKNFDFEGWAKDKHVYLASYTAFQPYKHELVRHLFIPLEEIREEIDRRSCLFSEYMVGVHIRRTDNKDSILHSPIELFYSKLDQDIKDCDQIGIYLATDSEEVKQVMRKRYGDRLLVSDKQAGRDSLEGIKDGIVDMYTLSRTQKIYGSFQSSFSDMAAQIGGVPLEILKQ